MKDLLTKVGELTEKINESTTIIELCETYKLILQDAASTICVLDKDGGITELPSIIELEPIKGYICNLIAEKAGNAEEFLENILSSQNPKRKVARKSE